MKRSQLSAVYRPRRGFLFIIRPKPLLAVLRVSSPHSTLIIDIPNTISQGGTPTTAGTSKNPIVVNERDGSHPVTYPSTKLANASHAPRATFVILTPGKGTIRQTVAPSGASRPSFEQPRGLPSPSTILGSKSNRVSKPKRQNGGHLRAWFAEQKRAVSPVSSRSRQAPELPSMAAMLKANSSTKWQIEMAYHLTAQRIHGPFEIGDFLCKIDSPTCHIVKVAQRTFYPQQRRFYWCSISTSRPLRDSSTSTSQQHGYPAWGHDGAFYGFLASADRLVNAIPQLPPADKMSIPPSTVLSNKHPALRGDDPMWF